jgi:hypothetical protein
MNCIASAGRISPFIWTSMQVSVLAFSGLQYPGVTQNFAAEAVDDPPIAIPARVVARARISVLISHS